MISVNVNELKKIIAKLNLAVEKSKLNPKSGWIEIEVRSNHTMLVKVSNYDYFLESTIMYENGTEEANEDGILIHATVTAETFIPLVSKLEDGSIELEECLNSLVLRTAKSEYTFPIIKEMGKVKSVDKIVFNPTRCTRSSLKGYELASIADKNAKGLMDAVFSRDVQQFVYVDNKGALTYTENIYINDFDGDIEEGEEEPFQFLLNVTQAKLLKVFEEFGNVNVAVEYTEDYESSFKVEFSVEGVLKMVVITQSKQLTEKFPALRLRKLASAVSETHAILDKKTFEKALNRLMVFDKKFDITVLNYSKFVWGTDSVKLVSIKNHNYEIVPYVSSTNTTEHESIIRFADIVNQLKAINSKEIDISYGDSPAIVINSDGLEQLIPEIRAVE